MTQGSGSAFGRALMTIASFVVVVAGLRAAETILVPFLLSVFIAILLAAPLVWLQKRGVPRMIAVIIVAAGIFGLYSGVRALVGHSYQEFEKALPKYRETVNQRYRHALDWLEKRNIKVSERELISSYNPGEALQMFGATMGGIGSVVTNAALILLTVTFMLLEASGLPAKLKAAFRRDPDRTLDYYNRVTDSVQRYLIIKTLVSLMTGAIVACWVWITQVDFPLLWGLVAFLLNYIPNIGSILAAIPAVVLAWIDHNLTYSLVLASGYVAINIFFGNFIEPRWMGRRFGLSTLVVFLSLVFWGWVLGPAGMLLSVPLTMIVKIALESSPETRWIAILLESEASDSISYREPEDMDKEDLDEDPLPGS